MKKETAAIFKTVVSLKTFRIFSKKKITGAATRNKQGNSYMTTVTAQPMIRLETALATAPIPRAAP